MFGKRDYLIIIIFNRKIISSGFIQNTAHDLIGHI
jgi:hypothetical protein